MVYDDNLRFYLDSSHLIGALSSILHDTRFTTNKYLAGSPLRPIPGKGLMMGYELIKFMSARKIARRSICHYPVAIVGGGPTGMLLSALLTQYGVKHALVERRKDPVAHPQAHFINMRSMEILQGQLPEVFQSVVNAAMDSDNWRC